MSQLVPSRTFDILPSIDVRGGKVVDLYQGDFNRETVYDDPAEAVARRFVDAGANWIHIVDLDGSRDGSGANREIVRQIVRLAAPTGVRLELGGGIRSLDAITQALDDGLARVIIGTAAVEEPDLVSRAVERFGSEAVIVGIDSRGGMVATRGWTQASRTPATALAEQMVERGVMRFICTDITRDSTLTEPNFDALAGVASAVAPANASVIASGGVTTVEHVRRLVSLGLEGAIIGSALYAGRLRLEDALAAAKDAKDAH
jgi:phosphoribosylformimino-5-aminoimidazole carboxamide ribotide isomerase